MKPQWTTPEIDEESVCWNCDADTDDGEWKARHAGDALCITTLEYI